MARLAIPSARLSVVLIAHLLLGATAQAQVCTQSPSDISLSRQLRQAYLDLLGRPPNLSEYAFTLQKGAITDDDLKELMRREEYYERMKGYHRALLRANISNSIYTQGDNRLNPTTDGARPLEIRGNPSAPLRGQNGVGCNHAIDQDQCATQHEDPNLEGNRTTCRDQLGVPLPVAVDYNATQYTCTALAATSCADAMTQGLVPAKHYFYCDMRLTGATTAPYYCLPSQTNPITAVLTTEELDSSGRVVAFTNPAAPAGQLARLERCTTNLSLNGGVKGRYVTQQGCIQREGYTSAPAPFFDTSGAATVTMCAIEAQARDVNPWTMESCETARFTGDRSCGCGVGARRCEPGSGALHTARIDAVNTEPLLIADSVLRRDEDYFTLLTTRRSFVNGTLSQLYKQKQSPTVWFATSPAAAAVVPDVAIGNTTTWVEYTRDANASGILTSAAWLYRFPTRRSRVNQFYGAFLCKSFAPPADAVPPSPEDSCNRENNLAKRCGCSYCHATIEPTGAHWGRYGERNAQYLDPVNFPKFSAKCRDCALAGDTTCDNQCGNYVMQAFDGAGASDLGLLTTYLYRTNEEEPNIEGGPALLVERMMQTGDLERCAVKNAWNALLGRAMTTDEETLNMGALLQAFAASNHNFKSLMLEIMKTDAYRRVD